MSHVTPLHVNETPLGALRNALSLAELYGNPLGGESWYQCRCAHDDVARLIRAALAKLSEPSAGAIRAAQTLAPTVSIGAHGEVNERWARDLCAAILHAQLTNE